MRKKIALVGLMWFVVSPPAWADSEASGEALAEVQTACRQFAAEDQIAPGQVEEYMANCIHDMSSITETEFTDFLVGEEAAPTGDGDRSR